MLRRRLKRFPRQVAVNPQVVLVAQALLALRALLALAETTRRPGVVVVVVRMKTASGKPSCEEKTRKRAM